MLRANFGGGVKVVAADGVNLFDHAVIDFAAIVDAKSADVDHPAQFFEPRRFENRFQILAATEISGIADDEIFLTDPRFAATNDRRANARALTAILDAWFATKDWPAWSTILDKTGVAFGVVATLDDIPHDVQMRASGALVPIDDPRAGASLTVSSPLQIKGQEKVPPTLAPEIGQHTVEVLRAAGIAAAEIDRLLEAGVIVQA